jgi:hypothetical protein
MKRPISPTAHGVIDYAYVAGLPMVGTMLGAGSHAKRLLKSAALSALIYSLFTRYKLALVPRLSMKTHVRLDFLNNGLLLSAPWLLRGERKDVLRAMVALGASGLAISLMTQTEDDRAIESGERPERSSRNDEPTHADGSPGLPGPAGTR